jgi:flagellar protein FliS
MLELAVQRYKTVIRSTSTPGELLLALYGGLFRFLRGARHCFEAGHKLKGRELVSKAHAIVAELDAALDHEVAPELCRNLEAVYGFCSDRLRTAARNASCKDLDDVIRALTPLHEAWQLAVPAAVREQGQADAPRARAGR